MAEKAKILLLSTAYLPHIGGSELAIKNITERLPDFEFDLITARLDKNTPEHERVGNLSIFRVGGSRSLANFLLPKTVLPLLIFFKAKKLLKKHDYITVHAFQASGAAGAGWLLKYFYPKLPFIITLQEGKNLQEQGLLINFFRKLILNKADRATVISRYLKNYVLGVNKNLKVDIIPNGVNIDDFSRNFSYGELTDLENELGLKPDDKVVISVSRLVPKNGLDLLIQALTFLNKDGRDEYKLILVGDGPLRESLKFKARALNNLSARSSTNDISAPIKSLKLEDIVIFVGTVNSKELPLYLKISDVFVRPSRSEGLGSAFLEAMAAGIPIIGTKVGGIPDFLEDPSTGSGQATGLFCSGEPEDIAFKIRIILENDKLREELVNNAAALVREKYDWNTIAQRFGNLYNGLKI